jgi:phosphonopyruvate decarboxylase
MKVHDFVENLKQLNGSFFTGVPDSQLGPLCNYLMKTYGIGDNHIIGANEGNCVALAAGYYLATGRVPVVYLQNSGLGNITNPVASLLHKKIYGIPCIFVIGWRGEPGVKDEPQHLFQGEVTIPFLELLGISAVIVDKDTKEEQLQKKVSEQKQLLDMGRSIAFVIKKGALTYEDKFTYNNEYHMKREEIIRRIVDISGEDIIVSTTGKASRELFEVREQRGQAHKYDFLTVGSMGHSSSIALGLALQKPNSRIWCIDGDGAILMHMGAMAVIGSNKPTNLVHLVINNRAHESVGGMPTVADNIKLAQIALGCGYSRARSVLNYDELNEALIEAKNSNILTFIEVKAAIGSRADLGRPTSTPKENKEKFMSYLNEVN